MPEVGVLSSSSSSASSGSEESEESSSSDNEEMPEAPPKQQPTGTLSLAHYTRYVSHEFNMNPFQFGLDRVVDQYCLKPQKYYKNVLSIVLYFCVC